MNVAISSETQKLLEERMKEGDYASADEVIRAALEALEGEDIEDLEGEDIEDLDPETQAAIERAEAEADRGEGIPLDEAFARLRQKHFGKWS